MSLNKASRKLYIWLGVYFSIIIMLYVLLLWKKIDTRMVILLRIIMMTLFMVSIIRLWKKDHAAKERERLINRAIQYAVSSNSPEENINNMVRYLGKELQAMRFFIFEDQKNGKYRGTYEWYDEELESASLDILYLPVAGIVDKIYEGFEKNNQHIIKNAEACKATIPSLYDFFKNNDIDNMVLESLEVNGNSFGICCVTDIPKNRLDDVAEILNLISYFISQLIMQREEQKRTYFYSYNDTLTGAFNNIAYKRFVENELDISEPFGYLRCDLIGLSEINVSQGYEVGDMIVIVLAKALIEVFGEKYVFRMNGTEFVAFGFETDEVHFNSDTSRVKRLASEKGIKVEFAPVYCMYGTSDIAMVVKRADNIMHENFEKMIVR